MRNPTHQEPPLLWHVHGTDASTGQPITLSVEDAAPTLAVQAALGKRILVSRVVRGAWLERKAVRNALLPLAAAAFCLLIPLCYGLYALNKIERGRASEALAQREDLAHSLAALLEKTKISYNVDAQTYTTEIENTRLQAAHLQNELASVRSQVEQSQARIAELDRLAATIPPLQKDLETARKNLADSQARSKSLDRQLAEQTQRASDLQKQSNDLQSRLRKVADTEAAANKILAANTQLTQQNEMLKAQLLELAAKPAETKEPDTLDPLPLASAARPWALPISRDAAMDFLAIRFTKDSITRTGPAAGIQTTRALNAQNACTLAITVDAQRVYSATFTTSLAAEAPKDKLAENTEALHAFAATFAPEWKTREAWLQSAIKALANKPRNERLQLVGDQFQATLWRDADVYSLKIESPRNALEN